MAAHSDAQIADWNGEQGRRWVEFQRQLDRMIGPSATRPCRRPPRSPGERVLDVGCGCGNTTLAQAVGPQGRVLGVDISQPMLDARMPSCGWNSSRLTLPSQHGLMHMTCCTRASA